MAAPAAGESTADDSVVQSVDNMFIRARCRSTSASSKPWTKINEMKQEDEGSELGFRNWNVSVTQLAWPCDT